MMRIIRKFLFLLKQIIERHFPHLLEVYRIYRATPKIKEPNYVPRLGFWFASHNEDMQKGTFEKDQMELVKKLLENADVFVNVGANVGYYCCIALKKGKHCVAIEPIPENLQMLQRNVVVNGWARNIQIFPVAVSDIDGVIEIFGGGTGASLLRGWAGQLNSRYVPALKLDQILSNQINKKILILMDIEGCELPALKGAETIMAESVIKPLWIVEISIDEHWPGALKINPHLLETFDLFWRHGYCAYTADIDLQLITRPTIEMIIKTGKNTLKTHNFLFLDHDVSNIRSVKELQ